MLQINKGNNATDYETYNKEKPLEPSSGFYLLSINQ